MKTEIGYKVVQENLRSSHELWDTSIVQYVVGEFVSRRPPVNGKKNGPLAVFKDLDSAKFFLVNAVSMIPLRIYKCEYVPSKEKYLRSVRRYGFNRARRSLNKCPIGTVFANRVKLLEEVQI